MGLAPLFPRCRGWMRKSGSDFLTVSTAGGEVEQTISLPESLGMSGEDNIRFDGLTDC
jgi:hypothetical protein